MYHVNFGGTPVYDGGNRELAKMIATAFAHAYGVRGWSGTALVMVVDFSSTMKSISGRLGHDAIEKVNDFFAHY